MLRWFLLVATVLLLTGCGTPADSQRGFFPSGTGITTARSSESVEKVVDDGSATKASPGSLFIETEIAARRRGLVEKTVSGTYSLTLDEDSGAGVFAFVEVSPGYYQIYAGPKMKVGCVDFGAGLGVEKAAEVPSMTRYAFYLYIDCGDEVVSLTYERGKVSGAALRLTWVHKLDDKFALGAMYDNRFGVGPRLEYKMSESGGTLWAAPMTGGERRGLTVMVGISFSF